MAILSRDQLMQIIQSKLTDSDDDLTILENITDTINEYEEKDKEDWKTKYEENDKQWRERYRARFLDPRPVPAEAETPLPEQEPEEPKSAHITVDELFSD